MLVWQAVMKCSSIMIDLMFCRRFLLARDVIYTSRAYATMSVSICLSVCL